MKIIPRLLFLLGVYQQINAQDSTFQYKQAQLNKNGMKVLGSWAVANILTGTPVYFLSNDDTYVKGFAGMSAAWNLINLALAANALLAKDKNFSSFSDLLKEQQKLEKIYLFNAGLDFGYIAGGFWLNQYGIAKENPMIQGAGQAIAAQGLFLLIFDATMFYLHNKQGKVLNKKVGEMELKLEGQGIQLKF